MKSTCFRIVLWAMAMVWFPGLRAQNIRSDTVQTVQKTDSVKPVSLKVPVFVSVGMTLGWMYDDVFRHHVWRPGAAGGIHFGITFTNKDEGTTFFRFGLVGARWNAFNEYESDGYRYVDGFELERNRLYAGLAYRYRKWYVEGGFYLPFLWEGTVHTQVFKDGELIYDDRHPMGWHNGFYKMKSLFYAGIRYRIYKKWGVMLTGGMASPLYHFYALECQITYNL